MSAKKIICLAILATLGGVQAQTESSNTDNSTDSATTTPKVAPIPNMPESVPGQCHALVNIPAKLKPSIEKVLVQDKGQTLEITPAKYKWVDKKVAITEEQKSYEIVPATYKTVKEKVLVEPEKKESKVIPAKYEETTKQILVKPALQVWRKSAAGAISLSGEVMRLIEQPAEYKTITVQKMVEPPQIQEVTIPAEYATVDKKVIDQPAKVKEIIIPAEYKTVRVKELDQASKQVRLDTPAKYVDITRQSIEEKAKLNWKRVPCASDLTEENIKAMQKGLRQAGYNVSVDGKFGKGSIDALRKYQEKKGLATGAITIETMRSLGIDIK